MNIISGWYFPWPIKIFAVVLIPLGIVKITTSPLIAGVLLLTGVIILTTHYGVNINLSKKTYKEYTWFLAWKKGKEIKFNTIEYLYIKPNTVTRGYNSKVQRSTISGVEYDGYLKFSENEKIHLANAGDRQKVVNKLVALKKYLNTRIMDYTKSVPDEI